MRSQCIFGIILLSTSEDVNHNQEEEKNMKNYQKKLDIVEMESRLYCIYCFQVLYILLYKYSLDQDLKVGGCQPNLNTLC